MTLKVHGSVSILVVDDSPETRSELQSILEGAGYQQILLAESAQEAFQRLSLGNASAPAEAVELVLMDIMMRDTDGVEACRRIKADKRYQDLPIRSRCKKIRDEHGQWHSVESYIKGHSEADFSHLICPECLDKHFPR